MKLAALVSVAAGSHRIVRTGAGIEVVPDQAKCQAADAFIKLVESMETVSGEARESEGYIQHVNETMRKVFDQQLERARETYNAQS